MTHIVAGNIAPGFSLKSLDNKEYSLATLVERGPEVPERPEILSIGRLVEESGG